MCIVCLIYSEDMAYVKKKYVNKIKTNVSLQASLSQVVFSVEFVILYICSGAAGIKIANGNIRLAYPETFKHIYSFCFCSGWLMCFEIRRDLL